MAVQEAKMSKEWVEKWLNNTMEAVKEGQEGNNNYGGDEGELQETIPEDSSGVSSDDSNDPYKGVFMSEGNKQTLRNIQLRQLAREHPHSSNFYNLSLEIRNQKDPAEVKKLMGKLYPLYRLGDGDEQNTREGPFSQETLARCLGTVKFGNGPGPKSIFDSDLCEKLKQLQLTKQAQQQRPTTSINEKVRFIHMQIELLYRYLQDYEEAQARISLLRYRSEYDQQQRMNALRCAEEILLNRILLRSLLAVEKGKMVVCRLLPCLSPEVGAKVASSFVDLIPSWKFAEDKKAHKVYTCFSYFLTDVDEGGLKCILGGINEEIIQKLISSELGMSLLTVILHCGQELYSKVGKVNPHFARMWQHFFHATSTIVGCLDSVSQPYEIFPAFIDHMKRDPDFTSNETCALWTGLLQVFRDCGSICTVDD